jgi:flagellar biosynthesis/type III secretory pathway protein FliH
VPEEFVPLAISLRAAAQSSPPEPPSRASASADGETFASEALRRDEILQELVLARLAALEAYERLTPSLLEALARDVLGRELALAPADLNRLAGELCEAAAGEEPVALIVAPDDAPAIACRLPVRTDIALRRGDLILEVRDGEIDARFNLRIAGVLER